jgi:hypothetical protein
MSKLLFYLNSSPVKSASQIFKKKRVPLKSGIATKEKKCKKCAQWTCIVCWDEQTFLWEISEKGVP